MKHGSFLITLVCAAALSLAAAAFVSASFSKMFPPARKALETRLDTIKRSGVLRCGYIVWPPFMTKDPNTGRLNGPFYELVEEMGRQLKLGVAWAAEAGPGQMLTDLALGRYDMMCTPAAMSPAHAREGAFTAPVAYLPIYLYARNGDERFDHNYESAGNPEIRFATLDGAYAGTAADEKFPRASKTALPQLSHAADLFMAVASKKADLVIEDPFSFHNYARTNPDKLRRVAGGPLAVLALGFPLPANEPAFKAMLDTTLAYLHDNGFIDKTLKKYEDPVKFVRVAPPFEKIGETEP